MSDLEKTLEDHFKRGFSHQYVSKIADKVAREGLINANHTQIEERMTFSRENHRIMRERLMTIVCWTPADGGQPPYNKDVIEAAKSLVGMDLVLLGAEID